jgi:ectoine hydroxylase-related dioxygenase (phytanoyl-CoA dioxygenase family)
MDMIRESLLAPAPATHGVGRRTAVHDPLDAHAEELRSAGYTVLDAGLTPQRLADLRERMEAVYRTQVDELGGEAALARCKDLDVARCPLAYDETFIGVAANAALVPLVQRLLGENIVLLQQNGLFNRPQAAHYQTHWHRDLSYQHWTSSEPLAINALLTLDDFTLENGATHVLPGSHLRAEFPSAAYVEKFEVPIVAPAGSFLVLDAMLFHRAASNRSNGQRRALNHLIGRPFMAPQFDLSRMVDARHAHDPFLNRYLGFRWAPCASVADWRRLRS